MGVIKVDGSYGQNNMSTSSGKGGYLLSVGKGPISWV